MMKKILVIGANGMFASDFISEVSLKNDYEIIALSREKLDITNIGNVQETIMYYKPQYVIHSAALTNVDFCESNYEKAYNINVIGTKNIAIWTQKVGAKLVYISSCGLFGDTIKEYCEADDVVLKTKYATSKYLGEEKVKNESSKYFIIRPGWLFGGNINHKKNFVYNRYLEAKGSKVIKSAIDKYGCPTYTKHLSGKIVEIMDTDLFGVYHITNSGSCNRFEYVKSIIDCFGLKTDVLGVNSDEFIRSAPVPNCEILKNENIINNGFGLLPDWENAIEEYIYYISKESAN